MLLGVHLEIFAELIGGGGKREEALNDWTKNDGICSVGQERQSPYKSRRQTQPPHEATKTITNKHPCKVFNLTLHISMYLRDKL